MTQAAEYLAIKPETALPGSAARPPFRAVVIVEATVSPEWQSLVSNWLVRSGCLYVMAWDANCSSWDNSVDMANMEQFDFGEIPEDRFVMTHGTRKNPWVKSSGPVRTMHFILLASLNARCCSTSLRTERGTHQGIHRCITSRSMGRPASCACRFPPAFGLRWPVTSNVMWRDHYES
jgi:hypothetical protein